MRQKVFDTMVSVSPWTLLEVAFYQEHDAPAEERQRVELLIQAFWVWLERAKQQQQSVHILGEGR